MTKPHKGMPAARNITGANLSGMDVLPLHQRVDENAAKELTIGLFGARHAAMPDLTVTIEALVADTIRMAASFV